VDAPADRPDAFGQAFLKRGLAIFVRKLNAPLSAGVPICQSREAGSHCFKIRFVE
jgi:hypothetical protein